MILLGELAIAKTDEVKKFVLDMIREMDLGIEDLLQKPCCRKNISD